MVQLGGFSLTRKQLQLHQKPGQNVKEFDLQFRIEITADRLD